MWKKVKEWAILPKEKESIGLQVPITTIEYSEEVKIFVQKAYKHYCEQCDQFYKSIAGAAVHKRLKHNKTYDK